MAIWEENEEIRSAFLDALEKTGHTDALKKAAERIPFLLLMRPEKVEAYMATRYHEV